jgi:lysozyme
MTDLQAMLIQQEGMELKPYVDTVGKMTIGVGRNLADKGLSREEAIVLLNNDIADAIEDVRHTFSCYDQLSRPRKMVLVSMAFNLGRERLSKFVRFIGSVHRGDWNNAAEELLDSKAAMQAPGRYKELARMMRDDTSAWI